MLTEASELSALPYSIIEEVGEEGIDISALLSKQNILEIYDNNINKIMMKVQKLVSFEIVKIVKTYEPEEGDSIKFVLTERGLKIFKNHYHE